MKKNYLSLAVITALSIVFTGCGSSSSDGGGSGSSLSFPSDAVQVEVNNEETATDVTEAVFDESGANATSLFSITDSNKVAIGTIVKNIKDIVKKTDTYESHALNETYSDSYDCAYGGSYSFSMSGSEENYSGTLTYSNCSMYGDNLINGKMSMSASNYDEDADNYETYKYSFVTDTTFSSGDEYNVIISSGSSVEETLTFGESDYWGWSDIISSTSKTSIIVTANGEKYGAKDLVTVEDWDNYSYYYTSGKIYINDLNGFVEVDTTYDGSTTPYDTYNYTLGNYGVGKFIGAGNSDITITQESSYYGYKVEVDTNNDGIVDNTYYID